MSITGQISLARPGEPVRTFQRAEDIKDIFDINSSPSLKPFDHVTLYPGDFTSVDDITIPENVFLTILPGAKVSYTEEINSIEERYENIDGAVKNIGDLNISDKYQTSSEFQHSRIRVYPSDPDLADRLDSVSSPYLSFSDLDAAIEAVEEGDKIVLFPGNYEPTRNLMINETTWNFLPGATVFYNPDFERDIDGDGSVENVCPHALFDDSKSIDGIQQTGIPKSVDILGQGTFIIGSSEETTLLNRTVDSTIYENFDPDTISAATDWEGWHKYSLLAVSHQSSNVNFEAKEIVMRENIDAPIKYTNSESLNVDIDTVRIDGDQKAGDNVKNISYFTDPRPKLPALFVINGTNKTRSGSEEISLNVSNFDFSTTWSGDMYILTAMNHTPEFDFDGDRDFPDDHRDPFEGVIEMEIQGHDNITQSVSFSGKLADDGKGRTSPRKVIIKNSNLFSPVFYRGNREYTDLGWREDEYSRVIIKNTNISTKENVAPITIDGDVTNLKFSISSLSLINEDGGDGDFCIRDRSNPDSDLLIKVYGNSFANLPVQDYEQVLHDQLNNIVWTEDVEPIQ